MHLTLCLPQQRLGRIAGLVVMLVAIGLMEGRAQQSGVAMFKSGVERVAIAAIVRDSRGRLVTDLEARDFELFDNGRPRPLIDVWAQPSAASIAVLMDASGSMATKMSRARETAQTLSAGLKSGSDEVALFSFDTSLREVRPFSTNTSSTESVWDATRAYGATSLWDAVAATTQQIANRQRRRAVVVITDGVDSASKLKPSDVSGIASALDVPVYMLVVTFTPESNQRDLTFVQGPLADLAAWTGGDSMLVHDAPSMVSATSQILTELHHQYVIAFEPAPTPGWHPLLVKARKPGLFVRTRSGYTVK